MESWRDRKLAFLLLTLPPAAWLLLFFTLPLAIVWVYSFAERGPQGQVLIAFTLANYERALEWIHLGIIWKSIWIAGIATAIMFVLGFPIAMGIAFAPGRYKNLLLLLVILPFWTNLLIRTYAWIAVLRTRGFLNFGLEWAHERLGLALGLLGMGDSLEPFRPLELLYNNTAVVVGLVYVYPVSRAAGVRDPRTARQVLPRGEPRPRRRALAHPRLDHDTARGARDPLGPSTRLHPEPRDVPHPRPARGYRQPDDRESGRSTVQLLARLAFRGGALFSAPLRNVHHPVAAGGLRGTGAGAGAQ